MELFIILILISISILLYYLYFKEKNANKEIENINTKRKKENEIINNENKKLIEEKENIQKEINQKQEDLSKMQNMINDANEISRKAFINYSELLDKEYISKEKEFNDSVKLLKRSYAEIQAQTLEDLDNVKSELDQLVATRAAAIQAQLKEEEIQKQSEFYSLVIDTLDRKEIKLLQSVESELRDPRPIRMIVWTAYYSKKANELASRVLGVNNITGIYKITNKNNKLCYIGKAVDIRERWREHMKCGLGIDTPANNKLYHAMKTEGLESFTFELLEECAAAQLSEKEAFYINLYNSKNYGYNSINGSKK